MACATLKRSLDWESMAQLPTKRRRCSPIATSPSTNPGIRMPEQRSVFGDAVSAPHTKLTPELLSLVRNEVKRLHRRRQLRMSGGAASSSSGSEGECSPPHPSSHQPHQTHGYNRALFTFKQVRMICERMLREQEMALRTEYETVLNSRLAEQYEAFVRFNIDQVQRRPPLAACAPLGTDDHMHQDLVPSYLS